MEGGSIPPIWCSKKNVARRSERRGTQTPLDSPDSSTQSESERKRGQEVQGFANGVSPLDMLTQTHSWNISAQDLVIRGPPPPVFRCPLARCLLFVHLCFISRFFAPLCAGEAQGADAKLA